MAVAVSDVAMGRDNGRNMHPFFMLKKSGIDQEQASHSMLPHDDKASSSLHDRPLNPSNSEDGRLSRGHGGKHSRSRRKVHSIVSSSNAAALEIQQQPATLSSSRMPESEGEGGREPDASTLETDLNQDRRKRQRTASPTGASFPSTPFTWGEQLKAAALEESAGAETEKEKVTDIASLEEEKVTKESGLRSYVELPKKEQNHSSSVKDKNVDPTDPPPPRLIKQQEMAMPEKVLKIRPDGRLGSPKKKGVVGNRKSGDKRKSRNPDFEPTRKIVTIKYGSDKESRALLARRIQEIISKEPNTSAEIRTPAPKAAGPSKPTHPFFLGALARNTDADQSTLDKDQKDMATQSSVMPGQEKETSPRKGTSAAKAAASKDAWERVGGFGGKSGDASNLRVTKFPGASEPLWPPKDMFHIRDLPAPIASIAEKIETLQLHQSPRKLKHAAIQIAEPEEVMLPYTALVRVYQKDADGLQDTTLSDVKTFHHPLRKVLTGRELQWAISRNLACRPAVQSAESKVQEGAEIHSSQIKYPSVHKAVLRAFEKVASSQSAFDRFECETQDWMHKYAPNCAEEILQQGHEATLLRSWLKSHTITTVESGKADIQKFKESSVVSGRHVRGSKRKKRKRVGELNDFIISTDEEADEMSELTYPEDIEQDKHALSPTKKSLVRNSDNPGVSKSGQQQKNANAVVISGPHGCGKTAAVYAVAQELGFEVFEINAGSRRNGKDLLDKVGDMSRNHLVNHTHSTEEGDLSESNESSLQLTESLEQELLSGRQGTMNSFFKPKDTMKKLAKGKPGRKRLASKVDEKPKPAKSQKQSLILLEEVDVLFEEDKQFWTVAFSLILQSKRPIIMTCADESLIPLDELILHAIFRFTPPPVQLATDYLLVIAGNEGHLLCREAVSTLFKSKCHDLRASIAELNFFCQMAIGDTKGGLEWMLIQPPGEKTQSEGCEDLRVVSEGTYFEGLGLLARNIPNSRLETSAVDEMELLSEAWSSWDTDPEKQEGFSEKEVVAPSSQQSRKTAFQSLLLIDQGLEALSAADTFPGFGFRDDSTAILDTTIPPLTSQVRANYAEGSTLLHADPMIDHTGMCIALATSLGIYARKILPSDESATVSPRGKVSLARSITASKQMVHSDILAAFDSLARPQDTPHVVLKGPRISSFDGPLSVVIEDMAPYVRSIVSYDIRLEEQRLQLSSLLSQRGRNGKRPRTTRASRAALEGGSKANTRRERWFPGNTNFSMVLQTGGTSWQEASFQRATLNASEEDTGYDNNSRRSSLVSTTGSEL